MSPEIPGKKPDIDPSILSAEILSRIHFVLGIGGNDEELGTLKGFLNEVQGAKISVKRLVEILSYVNQIITKKQNGMPGEGELY